jgi:phenylpropionate dioxygenase-like ring-hydroxylating dioxygenase large terminal subunit
MFDGFAEVWTPVLLSRRLKKRPVAVKIAGEKVVLFRDAQGQPAALLDRCPHRGVALSLGKVRGSCLECPFHGWQFDAQGQNRHVPLNPDAKRERLFARAFPVRELGDLLWLYTGAAPATEPNVPEVLTDGRVRTYVERTWSCHWTRAMENMLDSPHLPFVHRTTIGRPMAKKMTAHSKMVTSWEDTPWGGRQRSNLDGDTNLAFLEFHRPNMMSLHIPIPGKRLTIAALVIPVDERTTRLIVVGARDFLTWRALNPLFNRVNALIADQDKAVVESSDPPRVPPPSREVSVATDKPTLAFRKYYFEQLCDDAPLHGAPSSAA